ncbi:MAG: hypothetical protein HY710_10625 [Candidatus Latescibacteria bacterium]|nr:hypothetical protein [Candidatus Latescibacterota bacterium]
MTGLLERLRQFSAFLSLFILHSSLFALSTASAQTPAVPQHEEPPPQQLIDLPTAGVLPKGHTSLTLRVFSNGGLLGELSAGVLEHLALGLSFGGENIIGTGKVTWNPRPEVAIKYQLIEEDEHFPAIAIGFDSQGLGRYDDVLDRYQIKSRGFYGVASRNFAFLGTLGLHAGANYSLENTDASGRFDLFVGADKSINPNLTVLGEYDFAMNDNRARAAGYGRKRGYFNAGVRLMVGGRLGIEFDLRNLFDNRVGTSAPSRELKILYVEPW